MMIEMRRDGRSEQTDTDRRQIDKQDPRKGKYNGNGLRGDFTQRACKDGKKLDIENHEMSIKRKVSTCQPNAQADYEESLCISKR